MDQELTKFQLASQGYNWYTDTADNNLASRNHKLTIGNDGATINHRFTANVEKDGRRTFRYQHISTLGQFSNLSAEELRLQDYGMVDTMSTISTRTPIILATTQPLQFGSNNINGINGINGGVNINSENMQNMQNMQNMFVQVQSMENNGNGMQNINGINGMNNSGFSGISNINGMTNINIGNLSDIGHIGTINGITTISNIDSINNINSNYGNNGNSNSNSNSNGFEFSSIGSIVNSSINSINTGFLENMNSFNNFSNSNSNSNSNSTKLESSLNTELVELPSLVPAIKTENEDDFGHQQHQQHEQHFQEQQQDEQQQEHFSVNNLNNNFVNINRRIIMDIPATMNDCSQRDYSHFYNENNNNYSSYDTSSDMPPEIAQYEREMKLKNEQLNRRQQECDNHNNSIL